MGLRRSSEIASRLRVLDEAVSTNDVLTALAAEDFEPDLSTVVTLNQTGGRGRLGRVWVAPKDKALAVSVLLRPVLPAGEPLGVEHFGWLPLIAGVAMSTAIDAMVGGGRTKLKWPNDVQIDGFKVCGVLAELLPTADAVVIGAGVNLSLGADELPVPTATSLMLAGVHAVGEELVDVILSDYLTTLEELVTAFLRVGADAGASGILDLVCEWCSTLGQEVRVHLPGGDDLVGVATGIDATGRLVVQRTADGAVQAVAAGDVTHLRYE
jgi:BirA family biotin operon repressor/biotin-[acetyl-CoA-carboxylase] ligase